MRENVLFKAGDGDSPGRDAPLMEKLKCSYRAGDAGWNLPILKNWSSMSGRHMRSGIFLSIIEKGIKLTF